MLEGLGLLYIPNHGLIMHLNGLTACTVCQSPIAASPLLASLMAGDQAASERVLCLALDFLLNKHISPRRNRIWPEAVFGQSMPCLRCSAQHESILTSLEPLAGSTAQVSRHLKTVQFRAELPKSTVISKLVLGKSTPVEAMAPDEPPVVAVALLLLLLSPKLLVLLPKDPSAAGDASIIQGVTDMPRCQYSMQPWSMAGMHRRQCKPCLAKTPPSTPSLDVSTVMQPDVHACVNSLFYARSKSKISRSRSICTRTWVDMRLEVAVRMHTQLQLLAISDCARGVVSGRMLISKAWS